ncbi:MAG: serine/threonine-protein phosphatase [Polyangiaceae bacterium]|jgi:serine/threonine protein phosphatase PrpC|nr:serine/threonine-protein phosphatase [Polyangiaceae bacterium]MBK8942413.1 serine/threonine-protein phosphatase [Polyangiaceae bacterium]
MTQPKLRLETAGRSVTGNVRGHNEDVVLVAPIGPRSAWLAVCDGMGGAAGGEVASAVTANVIASAVADGVPVEVGGRVARALQTASEALRAMGDREPRYRGMGTTATVLAVTSELEAVIGQVGDSRAYLLRGAHFVQLTRDQTLVQLMVEKGQLRPEEARDAPFANIVTQAIGATEDLLVDLKRISLRSGDVLLLCSDGLSGALSDDAIEEVLRTIDEPCLACDALIELSLEAGATDNVSCIVAKITSEDEPEPASSSRPRAKTLELLL